MSSGGQPRRSLQQKLQRLVLTATSAALLISAAALLLFEIRRFRNEGISDLRSQAELVAQSLRPTLQFDDPKAARQALDTLAARTQIIAVAAYRPDGTRFASFVAAGVAGTDDAPLPTILPTSDPGPLVSGAEIKLLHPVLQDGEQIGTLYLHGRYDLYGQLGSFLVILAVALIAGMALSAAIFRRLHPLVTGPLLEVAAAARRLVHQRDYGIEVSARSDDEVGDLVLAFNTMVKDLAQEMDERQRAEQGLRDADQRKDEFLALLAHELRNPMAPIMNAMALLERSDDPAVHDRGRAIMKRQLALMVRLIDDLLEVSRITRGKLELRLATVDLADLARGVADSVRSAVAEKSQRLQTRIPTQPVWIQADPQRITQVLMNLLNNAIKYTPQDGELQLEVVDHGDIAEAVVTDNGMGIAPDQQEAIFNPFVQVDKSLGRGAAGIGIGLTIARELVQMHGGTLSVHSSGLGEGARFTATLPRAAAPAQEVAAVPRGSADGRLSVVVADDNRDFVDSFAALLTDAGHAVTVAYDGAAALAEIQRTQPDAALLDIGMPGLSGYEVARAVRADAVVGRLTLVAITGWGQPADREKVFAAGFDHHWVKPVDLDKALAFLAQLKS